MNKTGKPLITRAVQYVRMSTDHQKYSIENQQLQIADYAHVRGYEIIETYADEGRSGVTLKGRTELARLLRDVVDPNRSFSKILVLDVSRWGRFQDPDQPAAYEFICREMGVQVEYAAEPFNNETGLASSLLKHMKRIMAGEYSRELSAKIGFAQQRCAKLGYKQGGTLTYGLKRLLVDANGNPKCELLYGQRKSISDDRVVIVPGPKDEQKTIKYIFALFLKGRSLITISRHLNYKNTPSYAVGPWSDNKVKAVLKNELYTGVYVYNKSSQKLKTPCTPNPSSLWIRITVCQGMIDQRTFARAQELLKGLHTKKSCRLSSEKMLDALRKLLAENGYLSSSLIRDCPSVPSSTVYYKRFGPMRNIYNLLGCKKGKNKQLRVTEKRKRRIKKAYNKEDIINILKSILFEHDFLSIKLLENHYEAPPFTVLKKIFGSATNAIRAVGYEYDAYNPNLHHQMGDNKALEKLRHLHNMYGYITPELITANPYSPSSLWYVRRFGSIAVACKQAGIEYTPGTTNLLLKDQMRRDLSDVLEGGHVPFRPISGHLLDENLIALVQRIYEKHGYVTATLINADPDAPSPYYIAKRYPSILSLYAAAGLPTDMRSLQASRARLILGSPMYATEMGT